MSASKPHVICVGGGFTGLAAAHDLAASGLRVMVLEKEGYAGGLAASFDLDGRPLERFYHHWFNNDRDILNLIDELGCSGSILPRPTRTGIYVGGRFYRLSTPMDLLRFSPLGLIDRVRMGLLVLRARRVKDWKSLESLTAEQWLIKLCGRKVYEAVWSPLLRGKFGSCAPEISAVWMWNKLALRGGSRGKSGEEVLLYYKGGFESLVHKLATEIRASGGEIHTGAEVTGLMTGNGMVKGLKMAGGEILPADAVLLSLPLPAAAKLMDGHVPDEYLADLSRIEYLANVCLVLVLDRKLSDFYWLNVADQDFPYVGIIEHTNMEPPSTYGGRHIVYLSKYLPETDKLFTMDTEQVYKHSLPHLKRLFPEFSESMITGYRVFRSRHSQPVVVRNYSRLIPDAATPIQNLILATMAQIYPEDRGSSYAVREGRKAASMIKSLLKSG